MRTHTFQSLMNKNIDDKRFCCHDKFYYPRNIVVREIKLLLQKRKPSESNQNKGSRQYFKQTIPLLQEEERN
jgi:hypothetical protein